VQANPCNQDEQQQDRSRGAGEQEPAGRDCKRYGMHGRIIPHARAMQIRRCVLAHTLRIRASATIKTIEVPASNWGCAARKSDSPETGLAAGFETQFLENEIQAKES
jgi:hypothetical protein